MYHLQKEPDENHEFAFSDSYGGVIHITKVLQGGRHDFRCIGCNKPMQAVLRKIQTFKPYFRHDVQDVPVSARCTFSNEIYRKKIALDTLQLERRIRVPALYKVPPKGIEGLAFPLLPAQDMYFSEVKIGLCIYESEEGEVIFSYEKDMPNATLLLNADAVCYDDEKSATLLVLISDGKRKKMDVELLAALARLCINTVVITPAKASQEDIYNAVLNGKNTKWLYHDDERHFDYFSLSADFANGVSAVDVDQGLLYEETFDCRRAQVSNLIRAVNRCLGAEPYRSAENNNRRVIGETELAIRDAEGRRAELEERYRIVIEAEYSREVARVAKRREQFEVEEREFDRVATDLEQGYIAKRSELTESTKVVEADIRAAQLRIGGREKPVATLRREVERRINSARDRMDELYNRELQLLDSERRGIERSIASERSAVGQLQELIREEPKRLKRLEAEERAAINQTEAEGESLPSRFESEAQRVTAEFDELRNRATNAAKGRITTGDTGFARRLKVLMDGRGYFMAIQNAQSTYKRYRAIKEFIESAAGEAWLRAH